MTVNNKLPQWIDPKAQLPEATKENQLCLSAFLSRKFFVLLSDNTIKEAFFHPHPRTFYLKETLVPIPIKKWAEIYIPPIVDKEFALPKIPGWWISLREISKLEMFVSDCYTKSYMNLTYKGMVLNLFTLSEVYQFFNIDTGVLETITDRYELMSCIKKLQLGKFTHFAPSSNPGEPK